MKPAIAKANYVTDITVTDPDTKLPVEVTIFKHENGGMFGIDASYIDTIDDDNTFIPVPDLFDNENIENSNNVALFWND
jgi:hypothetical protein